MKVSPFSTNLYSIASYSNNLNASQISLNIHPQSHLGRDTVQFGMFKRKIEEATKRRDRIAVHPKATWQDKQEAQTYLEDVQNASKSPQKYHKDTKVKVRIGQGIVTGAATLIAGLHGIPTDPHTTHAVIENGILTICGTAGGTALRLKSTDPIVDALTDHKFPASHYPKMYTKTLAVSGTYWDRNKRNYFDLNGDRWEISEAAADEYRRATEKYIETQDAWQANEHGTAGGPYHNRWRAANEERENLIVKLASELIYKGQN